MLNEKIAKKCRKSKVILFTYRLLRDSMMILCKIVILFIPKKKNLFLFTAWFGEKYADNTMFFYEYLFNKTEFEVVWITKNQEVYNKLVKEHKPVVMSGTLKGIWTQIRAKVLFSTVQLSDYKQFLISGCIFIDLDHGMPFKMAGYTVKTNDNKYLIKHDKLVKLFVNYYMTATSYCCAKMMEYQYLVDFKNIILVGKIRHELFYDETMRIGLNGNIRELKKNYKIITYLPTHRSCGNVKINISTNLDLEYINEICKEKNYMFIIKKHFYHCLEREPLERYSNILDLTHDRGIDTQMLLYQTDILISDYSSAFIDYLLLERPILLYMYDAENFLKAERGFFFPFNKLGLEYTYTKNDFNSKLLDIINNTNEKYVNMTKKCKKIFFDDSINNSANSKEMLAKVVDILNGNKKMDWSKIEKECYSAPDLQDILGEIVKSCNKY